MKLLAIFDDLPLRGRIFFTGLLLATISVGVTACELPTPEQQQASNADRSRLIATVDGCRVWEVYNNEGSNPFLARCPEGAADTFESHKEGGKVKHTETTVTLGDH